MFSSRLPPLLSENVLSRAVTAAEARGAVFIDLTETNPTVVGLDFDDDVTAVLAAPEAARYAPAALGLASAREAIARSLSGGTPPGSLALTASTSEAYAFLFKLLADPGDDVLVPQPSYPLFDLLTRLEGVRAAPYQLDWHGSWSIDRGSLDRALSRRTRAVLVVNPNNPTGSMLRADDREWLVAIAAARGLAVIADEVFVDFPLNPRPDAASFAGEDRVLTFTLGGLSKSAGLPQLKLAWTAVTGPSALVASALDRLAVIADTYLSVSTPVQLAVPRLLGIGQRRAAVIQTRLSSNLAALTRAVADYPSLSLLTPEGGWSAVVRVPAVASEDDLVLRLLDAGVRVHPGYFFDFPHEAFLVMSLLPPPDRFEEALARALPIVSEARS
jgi:aspartate/methionine/tyrosine aminotransferase